MSQKSNRKQSDKYPFKSLFKEGFVNSGNHLAEIIFQKRSEFFNSGSLPERFWITGNKLHGAYKGQVIVANRLLKEYDIDCIVEALKDERSKFIFKLQDPKLVPVLKEKQSSKKKKDFTKSEQVSLDKSKAFGKNKNLFKDL